MFAFDLAAFSLTFQLEQNNKLKTRKKKLVTKQRIRMDDMVLMNPNGPDVVGVGECNGMYYPKLDLLI